MSGVQWVYLYLNKQYIHCNEILWSLELQSVGSVKLSVVTPAEFIHFNWKSEKFMLMVTLFGSGSVLFTL